MTLIPPEPTRSPPGRAEGSRPLSSRPPAADLIPYSAKDLKYLWVLWDEAQTHQPSGLRHRNLCAGAGGVILIGWLIYGMGLSCSGSLGGSLMIGGALTGIWYYVKSRRHHRDSAPGG
jgi:hypothetical protein